LPCSRTTTGGGGTGTTEGEEQEGGDNSDGGDNNNGSGAHGTGPPGDTAQGANNNNSGDGGRSSQTQQRTRTYNVQDFQGTRHGSRSVLQSGAALHDSAPIEGPLYYSQYAQEHFTTGDHRRSIPCTIRVASILNELGEEIPVPPLVDPEEQFIEEYEQEEFLDEDLDENDSEVSAYTDNTLWSCFGESEPVFEVSKERPIEYSDRLGDDTARGRHAQGDDPNDPTDRIGEYDSAPTPITTTPPTSSADGDGNAESKESGYAPPPEKDPKTADDIKWMEGESTTADYEYTFKAKVNDTEAEDNYNDPKKQTRLSTPIREILDRQDCTEREKLLHLFFWMFVPSFWFMLLHWTNYYGTNVKVMQQTSGRANRAPGQPPYRSCFNKWVNLKVSDLITFVALLIGMACFTYKGSIRSYWATSHPGAIPAACFGVISGMSFLKFSMIASALHVVQPWSWNLDARNEDRDRLWYVRPVVDWLNRRFKQAVIPGAYWAYDEAMLASKHTYNSLRQYMRNKPTKWGVKAFMLCCSTTYYCYNFEIYAGKAQNPLTLGDRMLYGINDLETLRDLGIGATTVMHNVACLGDMNDGIKRVIFFDRYFTGLTLLLFLLRIGIYACGTVMTNRTKNSPVSTGPQTSGLKTRGDFRVVPDVSGKILSCTWYDNKLVHFLNTAFRASISFCMRRSKTNASEREKVDCPFLVRMYQIYMRGVDVFIICFIDIQTLRGLFNLLISPAIIFRCAPVYLVHSCKKVCVMMGRCI
jgi:hypothetical protein